jgi:hypothetical protein
MIKIRFPDTDSERKALGFLAGRFPFKKFADGCTFGMESALAPLSAQDISFSVEGPTTYEDVFPKGIY